MRALHRLVPSLLLFIQAQIRSSRRRAYLNRSDILTSICTVSPLTICYKRRAMSRYADPYDRGQYTDQAYNSQPPLPHRDSNASSSYQDDPVPYSEELRYPSYPSDPSAGGYQAYPSTEKMKEEGVYGHSTERAQPGRSGLREPTQSFAEMGPPPRSTGILRMWRKDERGKQWFRVSQWRRER